MINTKNNTVANDFINAQTRGKPAILDVCRFSNIQYQEGLPHLDGDKDISSAIESLREMNVFDYEEHSNLLFLTEDYEKFLKIYSDTNIADIKKKQSNIASSISHIKSRKQKDEDYSSEVNAINRNIINIKKTLKTNLQILNDKQLKYKGESNLQIKKDCLNDCKDELTSLSLALTVLDKFILERKKYFIVELGIESIKYNINSLVEVIRSIRENLVSIINELTKYLIQIEKEIEKIKHINLLYKLKYSGELLEKTNFEEVVSQRKKLSKKPKGSRLYHNDLDLVELLIEHYKDKRGKVIPIIEKEVLAPKTVTRTKDKPPYERVTISSKAAYTKFMEQEQDLATYLVSINIDRNKYISLFIRIMLNYHLYLDVSKNKTICINDFILPIIKKRN